jgi:hypothetical protein
LKGLLANPHSRLVSQFTAQMESLRTGWEADAAAGKRLK